MDIMVETFLDIDVSDLLVSTRRLQDQLYMEVCETYLSLTAILVWSFMKDHFTLVQVTIETKTQWEQIKNAARKQQELSQILT